MLHRGGDNQRVRVLRWAGRPLVGSPDVGEIRDRSRRRCIRGRTDLHERRTRLAPPLSRWRNQGQGNRRHLGCRNPRQGHHVGGLDAGHLIRVLIRGRIPNRGQGQCQDRNQARGESTPHRPAGKAKPQPGRVSRRQRGDPLRALLAPLGRRRNSGGSAGVRDRRQKLRLRSPHGDRDRRTDLRLVRVGAIRLDRFRFFGQAGQANQDGDRLAGPARSLVTRSLPGPCRRSRSSTFRGGHDRCPPGRCGCQFKSC